MAWISHACLGNVALLPKHWNNRDRCPSQPPRLLFNRH